MKKSRGFTAIELVLVVCCIGILVAISLPAYQDYTIRSRMTEALVLAEPVRLAVRDYYDRWGAFPADNAQAGLADAEAWRGEYVQSIRIENGIVFISLTSTVGPNMAGEELHLQPAVNAAHPTAAFAWRCEAAAVPEGFRLHAPLADALFVIPPKFLPVSCRPSRQ